jgi:AcrR family transcriptional regulator
MSTPKLRPAPTAPYTHTAKCEDTPSCARDRIFQAAKNLFYRYGIRGVSVDTIAAEAETTKVTLYRVFASKDDLVAAYLERAGNLYRQWFDEAVAAGGSDPASRITAVFDALTEQVQPERCRGCPFLMALTEYPDPDNAAHQEAVATKTWVRRRFGELTAELRTEGADDLADQLALLMEGVYGSAQALSADGPARHARALAEKLIAL